VNELSARQGKERLLGNESANVSALTERKSADEQAKLPRLQAIVVSVEAALSFLVQRHRLLHSAFLREALDGTLAAGRGADGGDGTQGLAEVLAKTHDGWRELAERSGTRTTHSQPSTGHAALVSTPRTTFGAPLDAVSLRADSVSGVPRVMNALFTRLLRGSSSDGTPFLHAEGLFRIAAAPDDLEAFRRSIDAGSDAGLSTVAQATDPHLLATAIKLFYRRLPTPLLPVASHAVFVTCGSEGAGGAGISMRHMSTLSEVLRAMPQPSLVNLHALVEVLGAVAAHEGTNRMSASNLALIFAPTICRSGPTGALSPSASASSELADVGAAAAALSILIIKRDECFPTLPSLLEVGGPADVSMSSRRSSAAAGGGGSWWYSDGGQQVGPVGGGELSALLASGRVSLNTWVFEAGTADWQELSTAAERLPQLSTL